MCVKGRTRRLELVGHLGPPNKSKFRFSAIFFFKSFPWIHISLTLYVHWSCFHRCVLYGPQRPIFSCDQAALWMVQSVCPSHLFWLCSHHGIIMKFSGVITNDKSNVHTKSQGQRSRSQRSKPHLAIAGSYSSFNSHMMMKWSTRLAVA